MKPFLFNFLENTGVLTHSTWLYVMDYLPVVQPGPACTGQAAGPKSRAENLLFDREGVYPDQWVWPGGVTDV